MSAKTDLSFHSGHRERLKEKFLADKLVDYEQLELLLSFAIPRRDVRPLARLLASRFGGVYYVFTADIKDLMAVPGVGRSTAVLIKLVHSLMSINHMKAMQGNAVFLNGNKSVIDYCRLKLSGKENEEVHILYLNADFCVVEHEVHSHGSIESSNIHIEQILKRALHDGIRSVILMHNHPSTDNTFSETDVIMTTELEMLLNKCGITLYDHFVVAGGVVHSMRAENLLNRSNFSN